MPLTAYEDRKNLLADMIVVREVAAYLLAQSPSNFEKLGAKLKTKIEQRLKKSRNMSRTSHQNELIRHLGRLKDLLEMVEDHRGES
jgi:hypothetical protein